MPHTISNDCIMCGACEDRCPTGAISKGSDQYVIDPDLCVDCWKCDDFCPVDAISE